MAVTGIQAHLEDISKIANCERIYQMDVEICVCGSHSNFFDNSCTVIDSSECPIVHVYQVL